MRPNFEIKRSEAQVGMGKKLCINVPFMNSCNKILGSCGFVESAQF